VKPPDDEISRAASRVPGAGDQAEATRLIQSCQGLVRSLAWQIHQRVKLRVELDDLVAYGQVGLAEAAARFDASQGNRFITYAYQRIRGAIFDGLSEMGWFRHADFYRGRYERLADEVIGASPGDEPESDARRLEQEARWLTDVSVRLSLVFLASGLAVSQDQRSALAIEDPGAPSPQGELLLQELRTAVRDLIEELPEQGRRLLHWIYYDGLSLTAASKQMAIGKSWGSRLHDRMLRQLAMALRKIGLGVPA
jgi:RNA polymerase sigma factor for flagellar operon FliA